MRELDALIVRRSRPALIVSDNGTELTSRAVLERTNRISTLWHDIAPDKHSQNAMIQRVPPHETILNLPPWRATGRKQMLNTA